MAAHFNSLAVTALTESLLAHAHLPRLPPAHIARRRLSERLLKSPCTVKLLSAPAGFGKSVLLNECARQTPSDTRLVWFECLGRSVSCEQFFQALLKRLDTQSQGPANVATVLRALEAEQGPVRILIDDYPRHSDELLDEQVNLLLEQSPAHVSWWISARAVPKWNLPRLILQGDLLELQAQELALTEEELTLLLKQHRLDLPPSLAAELLAFSEGWLAGVRLLLLDADAKSVAQRLQAGTPFLLEYVQREVLQNLSEELRQALYTLVYMPRFNRSLCEHLFEYGADVLDCLRARQLFIKPLDSAGQWFRLWQPLTHILLQMPDKLPATQVYVRACQWFSARGHFREAVEYSLRAGQPEVAASFLVRFDQEQLLVGHSVSQFLKWRSELPNELFTSSPRLIVLRAWALIISARLDEASSCLAALANYFPQPTAARQEALLAHWQALKGVLSRQLGDPCAREHCLGALAHLKEKDWSQQVLCHQALAQQALAQGALDNAQSYISEALRISRQHGSVLFEGLISLDQVQLLELQGELSQALEVAHLSLQHLTSAGQDSPVLGRTLILKGYLLACQGRDLEAKEVYQQGSDAAEESEDAHTIFGYLGIASLSARAGDRQKAFLHLAQAERLMQWRHVPKIRYQGLIAMISAGIWLQEGLAGKAREALVQVLTHYQDHQLLAPSGCYDLLYRLRRYLALAELMQGNGDKARRDLLALIYESEELGLRSIACECRFSLAETLYVQGEYESATCQLREAFQQAQVIGLVRPLVDMQNAHHDWVRQSLPEYKGASSLGFGRVSEEALSAPNSLETSPLSVREIAVLRLIAQGLSNQEIAQSLFISLHTVKTHARRINTKLGVERRTQAVARAKSIGVLA